MMKSGFTPRMQGFVLAAILACAPHFVVADDKPAAPAAPAGLKAPAAGAAEEQKGPLKFESKSVYFGRVKEGEKVEVEFPVSNVSDKVVKITVKPSCGCTAATNNPSEIKPGENTKLHVTFDSKGRVGEAHKSVTVMTDDPEFGSYSLSFNGKVYTDIYLKEQSLDMGRIHAGESATKEFRVISTLADPLTFSKIEASDARLQVKLKDQKPFESKEEKGTEYVFEATIGKDYPITNTLSNLVTITPDGEGRQPLRLSVRGMVVGDVMAQPERYFFNVPVGTEQSRDVRISATGGKAFTIEGFKTQNPDDNLTFKITDDGKESKVITASLKAPETPKTYANTVNVLYKIEGTEATQTLPIQYTVAIRAQMPKPPVASLTGPAGAQQQAPAQQPKPATPAGK